MRLSDEQELFIQVALTGQNVLVDACIGSGKTTAIQELCSRYPAGTSILYLTYNKLLKLDAQAKIQQSGVRVTNYHGFAFMELMHMGVDCGQGDQVQLYNQYKPKPARYDVLILDEYQDIEQELADMLWNIKAHLPNIQVVAVGDMAQKIYDKTRLDASDFIRQFLGGGYAQLEFTACFRISDRLASWLSDIWGKKIVGVNDDCDVRKVSFMEAAEFLSEKEPGEVLCLGANKAGNHGVPERARMQNYLEQNFPEKFNRNTVWSKINDGEGGSTTPQAGCAVFTTFDGCKGMERNTCVVFDFTKGYWGTRMSKDVKYDIIRNIFCVAASRGKRHILFVVPEDDKGKQFPERMLGADDITKNQKGRAVLADVPISGMFDFKFIEDVEAAYKLVQTYTLQPAGDVIDTPVGVGLIDISACVGIFMENDYFDNNSVDNAIEAFFRAKPSQECLRQEYEDWDVGHKILYLSYLETGQARYLNQVPLPFVNQNCAERMRKRLAGRLPKDARVQVPMEFSFQKAGGFSVAFSARGLADVLVDCEDGKQRVYELKFVSELSHVHVLQCACYIVAMGLEEGYLWNIRDGKMLSVKVADRWAFMDAVTKAVTKGTIARYRGSLEPKLGRREAGSLAGDRKPKARAKAASTTVIEAKDSDYRVGSFQMNHKPYGLGGTSRNLGVTAHGRKRRELV